MSPRPPEGRSASVANDNAVAAGARLTEVVGDAAAIVRVMVIVIDYFRGRGIAYRSSREMSVPREMPRTLAARV